MIKRRKIKKWESPYFVYCVGGALDHKRIEITYLGQEIRVPTFSETETITIQFYDLHPFPDGTIVGIYRKP